jgi:Tol biopolymer transport system component
MRPLALSLSMLAAAVVAMADDASSESRFISNARQLIYEGKRSGEGYFHPDGNLLVFQGEREEGNPFYQIYLLDLVSGETARVSPGIGKTTCAFFQPGTSRLLFASTHHDPKAKEKMQAEIDFRASGKQRRYAWDYDDAMDIFSCQQDGTQLVQLTKERGYDAEASFSPDGKQIVFCSLRAAYEGELSPEEKLRLERDAAWFGDLYLMNADGSNVRRLTKTPGYDGGPFFSPDGQRIIWRRFDEQGMNADVYTMKTDGTDVRRVTDFKSMSWAPYYHPSGKYVIFTTNKLGFENFELFIVDAEGTKEPVRVTFTDGFDGLPVFSPDGTKLCWTTNRGSERKSQLWLANWNHEAALEAIANAPQRAGTAATSGTPEPPVAKGDATPSGPPHVGSLILAPEIRAEDLKLEVGWMAAPARAGRQTGTPGAAATAEWLSEYCKSIGLKSIVSEAYYEPFEFDAGVKMVPGKNSLSAKIDPPKDGPAAAWNFKVVVPHVFPPDKSFRPLAFSDGGKVEGEVVFAGYGLSVPENNGQPLYNSYDSLDVKDKIVLILRYVPEGVDPKRRAHLNRYAGLRYKAMMARERGAKAVLVVSGPNSPQAGELVPLTGDGALAGSEVLAASITGEVADALLQPSGKKLKDLQTDLDTENPHAEGGFVLPKVTVSLTLSVEHIKKTDRNVIATLPGTTDEWVVVGAHYDHLGTGGSSSLARAGEEGQIHYGADDNASGVATVMELAAALKSSKSPLRRGIIFALWSGEENGILGSAAFVENPPVPIEKIAAYVNFDMVGRIRENKLSMQGVGSSKLWRKLLEKRNVTAGFNLAMQDDPYLPTDVTSFYPKRVPVLNFFTGAHEDYHRPTDTPEKLDYNGMERIAKFAQQIVLDVANAAERPDYSRVERSDKGGGSRETLRAYLGTIPDYTQEVKGVKLSGVRAGSPAEKGGLQGGDIVVEFAGQKIANIYDYTYSLDAVKIGQPVKIVVERAGKRVDINVTPEARK